MQKVGFTGSTAVGSRIGELCGRHLQTPCLELGGKNPMVVMPDADLDLAVEGALFGGFGAAGQRCTSLGTLWVHDEVYDELAARFYAAVEAAVVGDPMREVLYGPLISERYLANHERNLGLVAEHHTVHGSTGTGRITSANPRRASSATRTRGVRAPDRGGRRHDRATRSTTPRPSGRWSGVGRFSSLDEAIELANGHGYGLSSSIYTTSRESVWRFRSRISAGMVSVNNSTSGAEAHLPFGGNGQAAATARGRAACGCSTSSPAGRR